MSAKSPPPPSQRPVPATPRVTSPSPAPSSSAAAAESHDAADGYFGPVMRSAARRMSSRSPISPPSSLPGTLGGRGEEDGTAHPTSPTRASLSAVKENGAVPSSSSSESQPARRRGGPFSPKPDGSVETTTARLARIDKKEMEAAAGKSNGHLSPYSAATRSVSRSPSPLGLIPIHRHWRSVIHRHEIPRKLLHVSIGFVTLFLYARGVRTAAITPWLAAALAPLAALDAARLRSPALNRAYVRVCGALMRESEVAGWNGAVWYLLGAAAALRAFPKDVGVMAVLLLSWCDTAASTVGRAWGRRTPRLRRGKSAAGSAAAGVAGAAAALLFWGVLAPRVDARLADPHGAFMFTGRLALPAPLVPLFSALSSSSAASAVATPGAQRPFISGALALGVMSLWTGLVGAVSEAVDVWGLDDNLTIPVLSGIGLWGFLKIFGA